MDELLEKAKSGDEAAMIALGDYYADRHDMDQAEQWYEKTAKTYGTIEAVLKLNNVLNANAMSADLIGAYDLACEYWRKLEQWSYRIIKATVDGERVIDRFSDDLADLCFQFYLDSLYGIGACLYLSKKGIDEAYDCVADSKETRERILKGLILIDLALDDTTHRADLGKLKEAFDCLSVIESDREYLSKSKPETEEILMAEGALQLAGLYQTGIPNVVSKDLGKAVNVLNLTANYVTGEKRKSALQREAGRYHKGLFGGYSYS